MVATFWANYALNAIYTANSGVIFYMGLSSTEPKADGTNVSEPTGGGYSRALVGRFTAPEDGLIKNMDVINFPQSVSSWFSDDKKAAYYVLFDGAGSSAHVLASGRLTIATAVPAGTRYSVPAGRLRIELTGTTTG